MKSFSAINPVVMKNTGCLIVKVHTPVINQSHLIMVFHYMLHLQLLNTFGSISSSAETINQFFDYLVGMALFEYSLTTCLVR